MEQKQKEMRIYVVLLLVLAAIDGYVTVTTYQNGGYGVDALSATYSMIPIEMLAKLAIVLITIAAVMTICKIIMSILGLLQVCNIYKGKMHIVLAWIAFICVVISLAGDIIRFYNVQSDWVSLSSSLAGFALTAIYIRAAQALRRNEAS